MSRADRRRRKAQPVDAAEAIAARAQRLREEEHARRFNPSRWGEEPISAERRAALEAKGAEVVTDLRGRVVRAHKTDIWASLRSRDGLTAEQYQAIRRLERDMIMRAGHGRSGNDGVIVDGSGDACAVTDRMVDAGRRVDAVLARVGPPPSRLLRALLEPGVNGLSVDWKAITFGITGEARPEAQSALLRNAAQSLMECYEGIDAAARAKTRQARAREATDAVAAELAEP